MIHTVCWDVRCLQRSPEFKGDGWRPKFDHVDRLLLRLVFTSAGARSCYQFSDLEKWWKTWVLFSVQDNAGRMTNLHNETIRLLSVHFLCATCRTDHDKSATIGSGLCTGHHRNAEGYRSCWLWLGGLCWVDRIEERLPLVQTPYMVRMPLAGYVLMLQKFTALWVFRGMHCMSKTF